MAAPAALWARMIVSVSPKRSAISIAGRPHTTASRLSRLSMRMFACWPYVDAELAARWQSARARRARAQGRRFAFRVLAVDHQVPAILRQRLADFEQVAFARARWPVPLDEPRSPWRATSDMLDLSAYRSSSAARSCRARARLRSAEHAGQLRRRLAVRAERSRLARRRWRELDDRRRGPPPASAWCASRAQVARVRRSTAQRREHARDGG